MFNKKNVLAGIEIGDHSIKVVIGEVLKDNSIVILDGEELVYSDPEEKFVIKGELKEVKMLESLLGDALRNVESRNKVKISEVCVGVTGNHIQGSVQTRRYPISSESGVVEEEDLLGIQEDVMLVAVPHNCTALHVAPRRYTLDNKQEVPNPLGQRSGVLEVELLTVICDSQVTDTLDVIFRELIDSVPTHFVFNGLANAEAVLEDNDKNRGTLVIDLGDGVTEYCLYYGDNCLYAGQKIIGCQHIANDLAIGLDLSYAKAKSLVREHVSAVSKAENQNIMVTIDDGKGGKRHLPLASIEKIAELRLQELLTVIKDELATHKVLDRIGNKVIITGGGALLPDIIKLTRQVFSNIPVEIGSPKVESFIPEAINNPRFTTAVGLLLFACDNVEDGRQRTMIEQVKKDCGGIIKDIVEGWHSFWGSINF